MPQRNFIILVKDLKDTRIKPYYHSINSKKEKKFKKALERIKSTHLR
jgi:hypothetical protein